MSLAQHMRLDEFRLSTIGVPRLWRSTTLPANHMWADGSLALFADWPELKAVYDAGGFAGMLLAYNDSAATIAANLGKWRPNAANPSGLFLPSLGGQFFRGWVPGKGTAGQCNSPGLPEISGGFADLHIPIVSVPLTGAEFSGAISAGYAGTSASTLSAGGSGYVWNSWSITASRANAIYGRSASVMPQSVDKPIIVYLGMPK